MWPPQILKSMYIVHAFLNNTNLGSSLEEKIFRNLFLTRRDFTSSVNKYLHPHTTSLAIMLLGTYQLQRTL